MRLPDATLSIFSCSNTLRFIAKRRANRRAALLRLCAVPSVCPLVAPGLGNVTEGLQSLGRAAAQRDQPSPSIRVRDPWALLSLAPSKCRSVLALLIHRKSKSSIASRSLSVRAFASTKISQTGWRHRASRGFSAIAATTCVGSRSSCATGSDVPWCACDSAEPCTRSPQARGFAVAAYNDARDGCRTAALLGRHDAHPAGRDRRTPRSGPGASSIGLDQRHFRKALDACVPR